jgi:DDE family transposase
MAAKRRYPVRTAELVGFKYFRLLQEFLPRLHALGTQRDHAGNRALFYDQYMCLLLLYFFSPAIVSLRSLQQTTDLDKVQKLLGLRHVSLGSLSEATEVFKAEPLRQIVQELSQRAVPLQTGPDAQALRGLTAVDGTLLDALPKMTWALWQDDRHRGLKVHLHFEVLKGVPVDARVSPAASSEPAYLRAMLQSGRLYVTDRGYASFQLLADILRAGSSFVARIQNYTAFRVDQERPVPPAAQAAGVVRDTLLSRIGTEHHRDVLARPVRLVVVRIRKRDGTWDEVWLLTNRLDLSAQQVALAYRYRWTIELFFRWLKCILGCRHLIGLDANGVAVQVYVALIASLLVVLWTGRKPNRRTWEMIQFYLMGWATSAEFERHLAAERAKDEARRAKETARQTTART